MKKIEYQIKYSKIKNIYIQIKEGQVIIKAPKRVNKKEIEQLAKEKFGDLEGIAQQYLFYWKRENS